MFGYGYGYGPGCCNNTGGEWLWIIIIIFIVFFIFFRISSCHRTQHQKRCCSCNCPFSHLCLFHILVSPFSFHHLYYIPMSEECNLNFGCQHTHSTTKGKLFPQNNFPFSLFSTINLDRFTDKRGCTFSMLIDIMFKTLVCNIHLTESKQNFIGAMIITLCNMILQHFYKVLSFP